MHAILKFSFIWGSTAFCIRLNYCCCIINQISSEISSRCSYFFFFFAPGETVSALIARHTWFYTFTHIFNKPLLKMLTFKAASSLGLISSSWNSQHPELWQAFSSTQGYHQVHPPVSRLISMSQGCADNHHFPPSKPSCWSPEWRLSCLLKPVFTSPLRCCHNIFITLQLKPLMTPF